MSKINYKEIVDRGLTLSKLEAAELHSFVSQTAQHAGDDNEVLEPGFAAAHVERANVALPYVKPAPDISGEQAGQGNDLSHMDLRQGPSHGGKVLDGRIEKGKTFGK